MKFKPLLSLILLGALCLSSASCAVRRFEPSAGELSGIISSPSDLEAYISEYGQPLTFTVAENPNTEKLNGISAEWDPHFFMPYNTLTYDGLSCGQDDWELVVSRAEKLGLQKIRTMILPSWYEPVNDNNDSADIDFDGFAFDSTGIASVIKLFDACEKLGIDVNVTVWGVDISTSWLFVPNNDWVSVPADTDEFCENVSAFLQYMFNVKNYTCLKELTLYNEPSASFKNAAGKVVFDDYAALVRAVDSRLRADGIRDKIKLIVSDDVSSVSWFGNNASALSDIADGYSSHTYDFDDQSHHRRLEYWVQERFAVMDKYSETLLLVNEFGYSNSGVYVQRDIDKYSRGLFFAKAVCAWLNEGAAGMSHWTLFDQRYNGSSDRDSSLMQTGLFAYIDDNWAIRPLYHAFGLISKHTAVGDSIYAVSSETRKRCVATALRSEDGKWTYIVTNYSDSGILFKIENAAVSDNDFELYLYSEATVTDSDDLIPTSGTVYTNRTNTYLYLESGTFAVLSEN